MGSKKSWFSSVKKALSLDSKEKKAERAEKSKKKWFGKERQLVSGSPRPEIAEISHLNPVLDDVKVIMADNDSVKYDSSVSLDPIATDAEVAAAAHQVLLPSKMSRFVGKSKEEVAAIKVQTAFRGYMARRALRALKGLVRLKSLVDGPIVTRQTTNALKCLQTLSRVQCQIQSRRIRMVEENRALQRQLLQKHAKELDTSKMGEEWDDSLQSKEKIKASLLFKYEAAMRRERALAYSYTHQQMWKKSGRSSNLLFMDPTNPHWGWSWLERWMAARPWEDKDLNNDRSSKKGSSLIISGGEITKAFARHQLNSEIPTSPGNQKQSSDHQSPATPPPSKPTASSLVTRKSKSTGPKLSALNQDDDSRSILSAQSSERNRRHSIAGSSVRDDESLGSSASVPSYMVSTQSAKAKSRLLSPLGVENSNPSEKGSYPKKRLSFPPSPSQTRRHSGPPKVSSIPLVENAA